MYEFYSCLCYGFMTRNTRLCQAGQLLYNTAPGQTPKAVYQFLVHIISPVTDNCSFCKCERVRIFYNKKYALDIGWEHGLLGERGLDYIIL